jgi:hypothetical protein
LVGRNELNAHDSKVLLFLSGNARKTLAFFPQGGISATKIGGQVRFASTRKAESSLRFDWRRLSFTNFIWLSLL